MQRPSSYLLLHVRIVYPTEYIAKLVNLLVLYQVRGPKMMVRYFSHEVADLQPALDMLKRQNIDDYKVSTLA